MSSRMSWDIWIQGNAFACNQLVGDLLNMWILNKYWKIGPSDLEADFYFEKLRPMSVCHCQILRFRGRSGWKLASTTIIINIIVCMTRPPGTKVQCRRRSYHRKLPYTKSLTKVAYARGSAPGYDLVILLGCKLNRSGCVCQIDSWVRV